MIRLARRRRRGAGPFAIALACTVLVVGCTGGNGPTAVPSGAAATSPAPTRPPAPSPTIAPTTAPTAAPVPSGHLRVPSQFAVELEPGRYWSSPPFEIGFSFVVDQPGWFAGHLDAEFFDIQRDTDGGGPEWPQSILGWGMPAFVRGASDIPVTELTPSEAVAELRARPSLGASNVVELQLFGRPAVRVDLHPLVQSPVFGGPGGTFSAGPPLDARVAFVAYEQRLLVVLLQSGVGDLEARWLEALPIVESVGLPKG